MDTDLTGKLLIALPGIGDSRFARSVILICAHSPEFAMGIVLNKPIANLRLPELLDQLDIEGADEVEDTFVLNGGPVATDRGFVLHTDDVISDGATLEIEGDLCMTATRDILHTLASGTPPRRSVMALGYSGWGAGQLESELADNAWIVSDADPDLVFGSAHERKWRHALGRLGIDSGRLQVDPGNA
ncbi:MAG: YqgE/AlgH family protein [Hyphomonas sp.]|nr:YqgE/AlgH family protein [Hyphomonas sp.]